MISNKESDLRHEHQTHSTNIQQGESFKKCGRRLHRIDYSTSIRFTLQTSNTFYKHPTRRVFLKMWPEATSKRLQYKHQVYVTNIIHLLQASNKASTLKNLARRHIESTTLQASDLRHKHQTHSTSIQQGEYFKRMWQEATSNRLLYKHQIYVTNTRHIIQASNRERIFKKCGRRPHRIDYYTSIRFTSQTSNTFYKHPTRRVFKQMRNTSITYTLQTSDSFYKHPTRTVFQKMWPDATSNRLLLQASDLRYKHQTYSTSIRQGEYFFMWPEVTSKRRLYKHQIYVTNIIHILQASNKASS